MESLHDKLRTLIAPIVEQENVDFVDLEIKGSKNNPVIKLFVDVPGGIKIKQCAVLSSQISRLIDFSDLFPGAYRLEVSSPGIDRPLRSQRDFYRNVGRMIEVTYGMTDRPGCKAMGTIKDVDERNVTLVGKDGGDVVIPLQKIERALIQIQW